MKKQTKFIALLLIATLLFAEQTSAQVFKKRSSSHYTPPKVILVQLNTYPTKVKVLHENRDANSVKLLKGQSDTIMQRMVADFNDNFTYCPHYFYIDTNADLIKKGELNGILLDKDLRPVTMAPINDTNYRIVLFGVNAPPLEKYKTHTENDLYDASYSLGSSKPGLVLLRYNFDYVKYPEPYFTTHKIKQLKQPFDSYVFISKRFTNVLYRPYARSLSNAFATFYKK